jgi:hypothetical protein
LELDKDVGKSSPCSGFVVESDEATNTNTAIDSSITVQLKTAGAVLTNSNNKGLQQVLIS